MTTPIMNPPPNPTDGGEPRITIRFTPALSGEERSNLYIDVEKDGET